MRILGLDVGGANTKAALLECEAGQLRERVGQRPLPVWQQPQDLPGAIRDLAAALGPAGAVALTMTAELCDVFPSKRDGVRAVLAAVGQALPNVPVYVWTVAGRFATLAEAEADPLPCAAANWLATATWLARHCAEALLVDVGSTTADLVPIAGGRVAAAARDDTGRLSSGELVYTGVLRTPVCALAPAVPFRGGWCRLAAELFAIAADVHLVLGHITAEDYTCATPDGRPPTLECSRVRLSRAVCGDAEAVSPAEVDAIARYLAEAQVRAVLDAAWQVLSRFPGWQPAVVGAGLGAFVAREVARRAGLPYRDLAGVTGSHGGQAAPAAAVARLLAWEHGWLPGPWPEREGR